MKKNKLHIKNNDNVIVIAGNDKGKKGSVIAVDVKNNKVKVHGIALVSRHYKARKEGEKSSIRIVERFIDVSNVKLVEKN